MSTVAGASGAAFGSPVQGIGNAMYFGDAYGGGQFLTDVLAGGILGGVAGGVAGWIKNLKNVRNGGQPGDIWGFGRAGKGQGVVEWGELKLSRQQDGFDLNYANPSQNRPPIEGLEYLDEGVSTTPQPFAGVHPGVGRIQAGSLKEFKSLVQQLSKPGSQLTKAELQQFEKLTEQFGGKLRYDLNPVKGRILQPHVQVEGLGTSVGSRHIWLGGGIK